MGTIENLEIKNLLRKKRIRQYELAAELNISEFTLSRWLRDKLPKDKNEEIIKAIQRIIKRDSEGDLNESNDNDGF